VLSQSFGDEGSQCHLIHHTPLIQLRLNFYLFPNIKNCDEWDETGSCFKDPTDRDERTEGDRARIVFSGI
jgi:hypothetical protein